MVKAIIFDLDDTLISERQYIESGFRHIAKVLSNRLNKDEEFLFQSLLEMFHESPKNVFNRLLSKFRVGYEKNTIIEIVNEYRNHFPVIEFYDDVLPCLEGLKIKGIKVGIITDGYANAQRQKLNAVRAYEHFDEIIITDELGAEYWKPHPKAFELIREKMDVDFSEMIYVGDNPEKDFYIGNILPIKTARLMRSKIIYWDRPYLNNIKENFVIIDLMDLMIKVD